jgi:hypothetical protein
MKRSRRVILTMMGTSTIAAISMGFIDRRNCAPGYVRDVSHLDGRAIVTCQPTAAYGGFGRFPHRHGHGHAHGGG